ncbi:MULTISPECIES: AraC family transcriptional regulator [Sphingobium]|uniref:Cupin n=2 Tax=Sphingobium TaxID=165695 RepID=A0ABQ1EX24_SPHSA|nr:MULTISPECIES: AraC family transcriptional regulator [Sphingobium]AJR23382.1 AraC family transcriptional regulator [Sphingobium sp. YBL2]RYL98179.1 AraC family transcriptional regulator [Sphingobium fuliginis]WDA34894.1 AraC family transcriptional regulator [Sphingobium sp. YC-XJ3]GFZ91314.1 cupin [Sphingobium fuliginis]
MDPLTEIFTQMRIRKAGFTRLDATAPWGFMSKGEQAVKFVLVVRGSGILISGNNAEPIPLRGGDVFIMLDDEPYRLFDHEGSQMIDCVDVEKLRVGHRIELGGGGALTTFVSGAFEIDALDAQPLLAVLPKLLHLKLDQNRSLAFQSVLELLAAETEAPGLGSEAVTSRLFELLFVHAIRALASQPGGPTHGWLAALADRNLAQAIKAVHAEPGRDWTVEALAREAGMSRSAFAARFKVVVGRTPLEYLTHWRIYRATRMIQRRGTALAEVSRSIGYESPAAFNRAFKKETGQTPGAFRKKIGLEIAPV